MRNPLRTYGWGVFLGDLFGGVIAALIALPYGLALAAFMGLPPILGLFTSLITAPICGLLGRNPVLIGGTSTVTVPFIAAAVRAQGLAGSAKVCIAAAVIMMAFCVLKLGRHVSHVPHAVLAGFSCGIGGMMIISQLKTIFDLKAPAGGWKDSMFAQLAQTFDKIGEMHWIPTVLAVIVIVVATIAVKVIPRGPSPLFGVIVAIMVAAVFGWHEKQVGRLPLEVPPFAGFIWQPSDVWNVLPQAFGLAFVTSVNLLVTSRVVDHFRGRHQHFDKADADAELGVYGIANIVAGMFGAPMSVGIPARSLANVQCGGTTRVSNLLHGVVLLGFLTLGATFISQIPMAALAGVTAWMGFRLLDWSTWRRLNKMRRVDAVAFLTTALAALLVNAIAAVAIGWSLYGVRLLVLRLMPQARFVKAAAAAEPK